MLRVQPLSKRHFYLGAAGNGCHFMCSKLHEKKKCIGKRTETNNQVPFPFCSAMKISSAKQFSTQLSCQAVRAALVSAAGSSWVPHSWEPHQRHHLSIWDCFLELCSPAPQLGARMTPMENRGSCSPLGTERAASPSHRAGSVFVNTVRLPGLECDFFGDLHLFESCPQGFPRIPFHLAEAQCSFSSFLV